MNRVNDIKETWQKLEEEHTPGVVKRALGTSLCLRTFCTYKCPDRVRGIAFSFNQCIHIDISIFNDLSELNISLFADTSFPDSKLLLIQLTNRESRVNDIFAIICNNLINAIQEMPSEKEGVRIVVSQLKKWKDLFSSRRSQTLSIQEQQGLYGELLFLRKLLLSRIDKVASLSYWIGPEMAPKDFQSDMWAVEVKTITENCFPNVSINGEQQLDESSVENLFLYNVVVEIPQQGGQLLPELVADIRGKLEQAPSALNAFERKLMLAGYFDSDEESYMERRYHISKEHFYRVADEFPRIKNVDLRAGVSDVKYSILLTLSTDKIVSEKSVLTIIESYERNQ